MGVDSVNKLTWRMKWVLKWLESSSDFARSAVCCFVIKKNYRSELGQHSLNPAGSSWHLILVLKPLQSAPPSIWWYTLLPLLPYEFLQPAAWQNANVSWMRTLWFRFPVSTSQLQCPVISLLSPSLALLLIHFTAVKTPHERQLTRSNRWRPPPTHTSTHTSTHTIQRRNNVSFRSLSSMQISIWFQIYIML